MSQLLYPPNTTFNCRSVFFPLKRTTPRFYPLNDSSIQRNNHTPGSIVPMFLSHSKAEKEKHHFVQQKQPPFPFISDLLGVPTPVRGHLLDSKVISTIKSENKRSKRRWNPNKTPKIQTVESKVNLGVEPGKATSRQHRNSQVTSQGLQYMDVSKK